MLKIDKTEYNGYIYDSLPILFQVKDEEITLNPKIDVTTPDKKDSLTVLKTWRNDTAEQRGTSIRVVLFKDNQKFEEVLISASNSWSYTWENLELTSHWTVVELVPAGYVKATQLKVL